MYSEIPPGSIFVFPGLTLDIISAPASSAGKARRMVMRENPVAGFKRCDFFADLDNFSGGFMTQNQRRLQLDIPWHNITGAYAACLCFEESIPRADARNRNVLYTDIVETI